MNDEISIKKGTNTDNKRLIKSWGSHLENRLNQSNQIPSQVKSKPSSYDETSPDLDDVFNGCIEKIKNNGGVIEKIVVTITLIIVSLYFYLILETFNNQVESQNKEISAKKTLAVNNDIQPSIADIETQLLPKSVAKAIESKISNLSLERDTYISNEISDYELSLEYVDALLHCDYLEFSGSVLSFKSSYKLNMACTNGDDTRYSVSEKQFIKSRDNLNISGYVYNGNIVLSHDDNVKFAEKMGYENLINYESRNEIQQDYISWLSKSLVAWDYISK